MPGIGEKSAARLSLFLIKADADYLTNLSEAIVDIRDKIKLCQVCFNLTEGEVCDICRNPSRSDSTICVVEEVQHLWAIEALGDFQGKYHVLHGALTSLGELDPEKLKITALLKRIEGGVREVILATDTDTDGELTAMYIAKLLNSYRVTVSRIASGVPMGGELEYIDQMTLSRALEERKKY